MKLKREFLQMVFGSILLALFLELQIVGSGQGFVNNLIGAVVIYVTSRLLALFFGGF